MSYQALYRQWRPLDFDEVIGQSHITIPLKNQIQSKSVGHAYVFSGTRGTGKTSTAKVFARAVNCLNNTDGNPCNQCANCLSILDEQFIDVIEMDAASNNSVDDIRELREHIKFAPSNGKYKVYIIDEVHMLSSGAFNALLKTLEEPPSYVLFVLATTEVHKIPQTILSRCQRFDFKRVSQEDIFSRLAHICKKLNVVYEDEALRLIIRKSDGAVRDSLSSLDQCLSISANQLTTLGVIEMLGLVERNIVLDLIRYMSLGKGGEALSLVHNILNSGKDITQFVNAIIEIYRDLLVTKLIDENYQLLINASQDYITLLIELSKSFTEPQITRGLNAFIELSKSIKYAQSQRIVFEATLVKVLHPEADPNIDSLLERISKLERAVKQLYDSNSHIERKVTYSEINHKVEKQNDQSVNQIDSQVDLNLEVKSESQVDSHGLENNNPTNEQIIESHVDSKLTSDALEIIEFAENDLTIESVKAVWHKFIETVNHEKKMIAPVLEGAIVHSIKGTNITIALIPQNQMFIGLLESKQNYDYLKNLISNLLQAIVNLVFVVQELEKSREEVKSVDEEQAIMDFFKDYKDVLEIK